MIVLNSIIQKSVTTMKRFLCIMTLMVTTVLVAQETWSATFRPTLHFPIKNVLGQSLRIGNGVDVTAGYNVGKQAKIYGGLIWNRFDTDEDFNDENIEFIQRGVVFGGMYFFHLVEDQNNSFYIRAGVTFMDTRSKSLNDNLAINTEWAIGTQLGVGIKITTFENWFLLPELRYGNTSNRFESNGSQNYFSFENISITGGLMYTF